MIEENKTAAGNKTQRKRPSTRNFAFYRHDECEYFPCHQTDDPKNFNCLFCYCPLYALGDRCGGNFRYNAKGIKDCTPCAIPHQRENYETIKGRFREIVEMVRKKEQDPSGEEAAAPAARKPL